MTRAYQTEPIGWAILDILEAQLSGALDNVEAEVTRDPLTLPDPVAYDMGFDEAILALAVDQFPVVSFIGAPLQPATGLRRSDQRVSEAIHNVTLEYAVVHLARDGATSRVLKHEAALVNFRYAEAIIGVLRNNGPYAGFEPTDELVPTVDEAQPMALKLNRNNASEITGYLVGARITYPMKGLYTA